MLEIRINRFGGASLEIIKNNWCQVENLLSIEGKTRDRHKLGFAKKSLGERGEENQEKGETCRVLQSPI